MPKKQKHLEINAFPDRLALPDNLVKEAIKKEVKLVIGTDSHYLESMKLMKYGVLVERRGWVSKHDIINTLSYNEIRKKLISNFKGVRINDITDFRYSGNFGDLFFWYL